LRSWSRIYAAFLADWFGNHWGIVAGAVLFVPVFAVFLRLSPDCTPQQIDGQCGFASFMDALYAAAL